MNSSFLGSQYSNCFVGVPCCGVTKMLPFIFSDGESNHRVIK